MWNRAAGQYWALMRLCAVAALAVFVSGCASTLSARVTSYQQWPTDAQGQSYRITPSASQVNNLEFQSIADMVRASIGATGLVEARAGQDARFDVSLLYENPVSQTWVQRRTDPYLYDGWGFSPFGGYYGGYGGFGGWGGGGIFMAPAYQNVPVEVYKNTLAVIIKDRRNNGAEVYRSSAVNVSSTDNLQQVMPYLAQAVFDGFPGNNGQVREVEYERAR